MIIRVFILSYFLSFFLAHFPIFYLYISMVEEKAGLPGYLFRGKRGMYLPQTPSNSRGACEFGVSAVWMILTLESQGQYESNRATCNTTSIALMDANRLKGA